MTEVAHLPRLSSAAERMHRYRLRRRLGHSCVTVELRGDKIAALISWGLLQLQREDRAAIAAATRNERLPVFAWLHRDEGRSGDCPTVGHGLSAGSVGAGTRT